MSTPNLPLPEYDIRLEDNISFLSSLEKGSVKLIVTSPPYNEDKEYEKKTTIEEWVKGQTEIIAACVPLLAEGGSICWQVGNHVTDDGEVYPLDALLFSVFKKHPELKCRNRIIWHYEHGLHCTKRFSGRHETILWFTKGECAFDLDPVRVPQKYPGKRHFKGKKAGQLSCNPKGKNPGDVWIIPNVKANHVEKTEHPCQFPVELVERLVLSMTLPGDLVVDPYMGSGSSAIAALKNGRRAAGCDITPKYINITADRIEKLRNGVLKTRPMNKPVHVPSGKLAETPEEFA